MVDFVMNTELQSSNRYDLSRFLKWHQDMFDSMDSRYIDELRVLPQAGNLPVVTQAYRPDLASWDIYNTTDLWGVLLIYNNIISTEHLVEGLVLRYPALSDLETLYFSLVGLQRSLERGTR